MELQFDNIENLATYMDGQHFDSKQNTNTSEGIFDQFARSKEDFSDRNYHVVYYMAKDTSTPGKVVTHILKETFDRDGDYVGFSRTEDDTHVHHVYTYKDGTEDTVSYEKETK